MSRWSAMIASARCGAKTRTGKPCRSPAVAGKLRCRMHGGSDGVGAPAGNSNALKSGDYTREVLEAVTVGRELLGQAKALLARHKEKGK